MSFFLNNFFKCGTVVLIMRKNKKRRLPYLLLLFILLLLKERLREGKGSSHYLCVS